VGWVFLWGIGRGFGWRLVGQEDEKFGWVLEADSSASLRNDNKRTGNNDCNRRFPSGMTTKKNRQQQLRQQLQLRPQIPFGNDSKGQQLQKSGEVAWLLLAEEADFAGGAVGAEVVGKVEGGSGAGGDGGVGAEAAEAEEA
jgi:hypothetical protein